MVAVYSFINKIITLITIFDWNLPMNIWVKTKSQYQLLLLDIVQFEKFKVQKLNIGGISYFVELRQNPNYIKWTESIT